MTRTTTVTKTRARQQTKQETPEQSSSSEDDVSSEEEAGSSHGGRRSKPSQNQRRGESQNSNQDTNTAVDDCIQFLLVAHQNLVPIKRADISRYAGSGRSRGFEAIFEDVQERLEQVYGMEVVALPDCTDYILINKHKTATEFVIRTDEENIEQGLLISILSMIFMVGNPVDEEALAKFLEAFGLELESKEKIEGLEVSVKELIQTWIRQKYLKCDKEKVGETVSLRYTWGFRADKEFRKQDVLNMVCEIYGVNPSAWKTQQAAVLREQASIETQNNNRHA